jgi:hypothetical protein
MPLSILFSLCRQRRIRHAARAAASRDMLSPDARLSLQLADCRHYYIAD